MNHGHGHTAALKDHDVVYRKLNEAISDVVSNLTTPRKDHVSVVLKEISKEYEHGFSAPSAITAEEVKFEVRVDEETKHLVIPASTKRHLEPWPLLMFNPRDQRRQAWDLLVIIPCLIFIIMMLPFRLCFNNEAVGIMWVIETAMDFIFILDIFINFRTAFEDKLSGGLIYTDGAVAKQYLKTWFALDLVSAIPFGILEADSLSDLSALKSLKSGRMLKVAKLLRFLKLSRLLKGSRFLQNLDAEYLDHLEDFLADGFTKTLVRMARIVVVMGVICHFMCCLWTLAGRIADKNGDDSWLANDLHHYTAEDTERGDKVADIYIAAYYFCFTTMTTCGYGDIYPYSNVERFMALFLQTCGGFSMAWIIASLTSIVTSEDANAQATAAHLDAVSSYITKMNIPSDLGRRIRRHFRHYYANKSSLDESTILMEMSTSLRQELTDFLVLGGSLKKVPLFKSLSPVHWGRVLPMLRPCMFTRHEVLARQGEDCTEAFFVGAGYLTGATCEDPSPLMKVHADAADAVLTRTNPAFAKMVALRELNRGESAVDDAALEAAASPTAGPSHRASFIGGGGGGAGAGGGGAKPRKTRRVSASAANLGGDAAKANSPASVELEALRCIGVFHKTIAQQCSSAEEASVSSERAARTSRASEDLNLEYTADLAQRLHLRVLVPGCMVNVMALLRVWYRCVETVRACDRCDCYAVSADTFFDEFKDEPAALKQMQEHICATQFKMATSGPAVAACVDGVAPTEFGVPVHVLSESAMEAAEAQFADKRFHQRRVAAKARARALGSDAGSSKGGTPLVGRAPSAGGARTRLSTQ